MGVGISKIVQYIRAIIIRNIFSRIKYAWIYDTVLFIVKTKQVQLRQLRQPKITTTCGPARYFIDTT